MILTNRFLSLSRILGLSLLAACASNDPATLGPDASAPRDGASMGSDGTVGTIPAWRLEDVQPKSPRAGQTYGLDTFANKSVVVVLLEGF